jgi:dTDP-4-dehydrorhamnose reductase
MGTTKVMVLGATGMLGHKLVQRLAPDPELDLTWTVRSDGTDPVVAAVPFLNGAGLITGIDAMQTDQVRALVERVRPDWLLNCVGVIKQRDQAHDALPSVAINSLLPHQLDAWMEPWGGRLVHFSTDCVFSGRDGLYTEDSPSDADDLYGKSKFLGEVAGPRALTIRSSIIGRELSHFASLVEWFLSNPEGARVRGFSRHLYSGVTTAYMADFVAGEIAADSPLSGLWQLAAPTIDKYSLLVLLRDAFGRDIEIELDDVPECDRSLDGSRLAAVRPDVRPNWQAMIHELAADPTPYASWRT